MLCVFYGLYILKLYAFAELLLIEKSLKYIRFVILRVRKEFVWLVMLYSTWIPISPQVLSRKIKIGWHWAYPWGSCPVRKIHLTRRHGMRPQYLQLAISSNEKVGRSKSQKSCGNFLRNPRKYHDRWSIPEKLLQTQQPMKKVVHTCTKTIVQIFCRLSKPTWQLLHIFYQLAFEATNKHHIQLPLNLILNVLVVRWKPITQWVAFWTDEFRVQLIACHPISKKTSPIPILSVEVWIEL